ncbi:hypothetical protein BTO30_10660 [Domibacillus antri]|uniref:Uncharacterized protein n=1 Tax=Domibacillus antri TaxID=1714264 RepID=A0A1Q8Q4I0_9BACI|nr:hypothetical protein [Domibacillus antri]OLN22202.1 hypothetical protein BTO30_10660 [Domibacillus antri]
MDFLHGYDFITPTSPAAAIFFGLLMSVMTAFLAYHEVKDKKVTVMALGTGVAVTFTGTALLKAIGFYG